MPRPTREPDGQWEEQARQRRRVLLDREFAALQARNERRIATFGLVPLGAALLAAVVVGGSISVTLALALSGVVLVLAAYYAFVVRPLIGRGRGTKLLPTVSVTLEVSAPACVMLLDVAMVGPAYSLTSTPQLLTFAAVALAGLRLNRWLPLYAGGLAAAQYLLVYGFAASQIPQGELLALPTLGPLFAGNHALYLLVMGGVASLVAHAGRNAAQRLTVQMLERERVQRVLGEYVAPQAVEQVLSGRLAMQGERREVTVLFADIRDFTPLCTETEPEQVVAYLNSYFDPICEIVARQGGMVNKFMGDGLLAVFGAPEPDPLHALHACQAAVEMIEVAPQVPRPDGTPTIIGVGVHTGTLVIGSIGSARRRDYTVVGDTVNTASRIQGLTRKGACDVLLSGAALQAAGGGVGMMVEEVGPVQVKGRATPVSLHRLLALEAPGGELDCVGQGATTQDQSGVGETEPAARV